jgi:hypothetical protein
MIAGRACAPRVSTPNMVDPARSCSHAHKHVRFDKSLLKGHSHMSWKAPAFEEINMSAEIGGYQGDFDGGNKPPAVAVSESAEQG